MSICFLSGDFVPRAEARISPLDRGFLFGDGVYEVIPVYGRRPFQLAAHIARLERSLAGIQISNPCTPAEWAELVKRLVEAQPWPDQAIYLQVTRGADTSRRKTKVPSSQASMAASAATSRSGLASMATTSPASK